MLSIQGSLRCLQQPKPERPAYRAGASPSPNRVAPPVADRSPLDRDQVKALVGAAFLVLTATYVFKSARTHHQRGAGQLDANSDSSSATTPATRSGASIAG